MTHLARVAGGIYIGTSWSGEDKWQRVCPQVKGNQTEGIALSSTHSCDQLTPIVNLKRDGRVGGLRNGACALLEETSLIVDGTMSA